MAVDRTKVTVMASDGHRPDSVTLLKKQQKRE